ncbi:MAG TPA: ABC transporter ATP-binding protein, partial [Steroidobacteraceae bacterium]
MTPPLLEIVDLNVAVGASATAAQTRVIKNLSMQAHAGEILGLVGASGSGKSMTALAIMQLLPPATTMTGMVRLRGEALTGKNAVQMQEVRGRDIGMVFQEPMTALNPLMRIGDQVAETLRLHRPISTIEARRAASEVLRTVGLRPEPAALDRFPHELSGGQRQRVAIAMAAVMQPPLLIADEPTTALDVISQAQVLSLLQELVRARNMGLILVTHDLAVVAQRADRVAVMQRGEIVEQGKTEEIIRRPQHPYTRALLTAASLTPKRSLDRGVIPSEHSSPVLQACGIVHEYPRKRTSLLSAAAPLRAVDGVSLSVRAGEIVGLVGESGSGKSSLLKVILALERSRAGQVRVLGEDFAGAGRADLHRLRRAVQAVFQDPYGSFDPRWTVEKLIAEPFFLLSSPPSPAQRRSRVAAALEQVGLTQADARRLPREFSGGERQRIAIARALITEPAVIAFDEAVAALDVLLRDQILELL